MNEPFAPAPRVVMPNAYSETTAEAVLAEVARGLSLAQVQRIEGMPTGTTIRRWARRRPAFAHRLAEARQAAQAQLTEAEGRALDTLTSLAFGRRGRPPLYDEAVAAAVLEAYAEGWSLKAICSRPGMPSRKTVADWVGERPEFAEAYRRAEVMRAYGAADELRDLARTVTPETLAVAWFQFEVLKWVAAKSAPARFGPKAALEPPPDIEDPIKAMAARYDDMGRHVERPEPGEPGYEAFCEFERLRQEAFEEECLVKCRVFGVKIDGPAEKALERERAKEGGVKAAGGGASGGVEKAADDS